MEKNIITISDKALEKVHEIMDRKEIADEYCLRIGVRGGAACMGVTFVLGFDKPKQEDISFNQEDIKIIIEKKQVMFLAGLRVDWIERKDEQGFTFLKPNQ